MKFILSILFVVTFSTVFAQNAKKKTTKTVVAPAVPIINPSDMVLVQGGTFDMGSTTDARDSKPIHSVTLSNFYIGKFEITQGQWRQLMDLKLASFPNCDDCPVESISWFEVQEFITKLNLKTGKTFRLPTEAEWEYAARGGSKSKGFKYSGSNDIETVGWYYDNDDSKTQVKGQKLPNELGLYDMTGNVWEWCQDWYSAYYYGDSQPANPQGPLEGTLKVLRGGGWFSPDKKCTVSYRDGYAPNGRGGHIGFRLVMTP